MSHPEQQPAWKRLSRLAIELARQSLRELVDDAERNARLRVELPGLLLDLTDVAEAQGWKDVVNPPSLLDACTYEGRIYRIEPE